MKKGILFGLIFGLVFGIIEFATVGLDWGFLYSITGMISLVGYILLLVYIVRDEAHKGKSYGSRFFAGVVFSACIGITYGILAGIAGFVFANQVAQSIQDGAGVLTDVGFSSELTGSISTEPTPFENLFEELFGSLAFNAFFGTIFAAIFATFFKEKAKEKVAIKKIDKAESEETVSK